MMSGKGPALRLVWLAALVLLTLIAAGFVFFENLAVRREHALHAFMYPDAAEVRVEFEYFTGHPLPETARVVLARRSRPSPLLGDYCGCALISLNTGALRAFLRALPPGKDASDRIPGCPDANAFWLIGADAPIISQKIIRKGTDEFVFIATVNDHTLFVNWVVY